MLLGMILALPFAWVLWFPIISNLLYYDHCYRYKRNSNKCLRVVLHILFTAISLLLTPIAMAISLFLSPFFLLGLLCGYCDERITMRRTYKANLKRKFGLNMNNAKLI